MSWLQSKEDFFLERTRTAQTYIIHNTLNYVSGQWLLLVKEETGMLFIVYPYHINQFPSIPKYLYSVIVGRFNRNLFLRKNGWLGYVLSTRYRIGVVTLLNWIMKLENFNICNTIFAFQHNFLLFLQNAFTRACYMY